MHDTPNRLQSDDLRRGHYGVPWHAKNMESDNVDGLLKYQQAGASPSKLALTPPCDSRRTGRQRRWTSASRCTSPSSSLETRSTNTADPVGGLRCSPTRSHPSTRPIRCQRFTSVPSSSRHHQAGCCCRGEEGDPLN